MSGSHARKENKRYAHYVCQVAQKGEAIRLLPKASEVVLVT